MMVSLKNKQNMYLVLNFLLLQLKVDSSPGFAGIKLIFFQVAAVFWI